jgi:hypothetical protein
MSWDNVWWYDSRLPESVLWCYPQGIPKEIKCIFYIKFTGCKLKIDYEITLNIESFAGGIHSGHRSSYSFCWASCLVCGDIVQAKASKPVLCTFFVKAIFCYSFFTSNIGDWSVGVSGGVRTGLPLKGKEKSKLISATYTWGRTTGRWYQLHETAIKIQPCMPRCQDVPGDCRRHVSCWTIRSPPLLQSMGSNPARSHVLSFAVSARSECTNV